MATVTATIPFLIDKLSAVWALIKFTDIAIKFREDKAYRLAYMEDENGEEIHIGWLSGGEFSSLVAANLVTAQGEVIRV